MAKPKRPRKVTADKIRRARLVEAVCDFRDSVSRFVVLPTPRVRKVLK